MQIENISDTARWMAYARAMESERPDAIFHDPLARRLAGSLGQEISIGVGDANMIAQAIAVRTAVIDELILQKVKQDSVDLILNIAAGLDTRPWRLTLPPTLKWVDMDLPGILNYKAEALRSDRPACNYESIQVDITDAAERTRAFSHCGAAQRVLVISEGLLVYLNSEQVSSLANDLHLNTSFKWWLADLAGPRALEMLQRVWGPMLRGADFQFGPADMAEFFGKLGWQELLFRSSQEESRRLGRTPRASILSRLLLAFSSAGLREEFRRLSGVGLFARV